MYLVIECPSLRPLPNGKITCSNFNRLGSRCGLVCNEGYELVGENQKICGADRSWDDQAPTLCLGNFYSLVLHDSLKRGTTESVCGQNNIVLFPFRSF